MLRFRSNPSFFLLIFSLFFLFVVSISGTAIPNHPRRFPDDVEIGGRSQFFDVLPWKTRRLMADEATPANSSLVLAQDRTRRKDPLDHLNRYTGGWNISNNHYIASVVFTAAPFFVVALIWFVLFGLSLFVICLCRCCCPREPYGYSRTAYALSLIFLILFTVAAIVGCVVLYTGQGKFHGSTSDFMDYVVKQADFTAENLRNVSDYLESAQKIGIEAVFLPSDVQTKIDNIQAKMGSAATTLSDKTQENSKKIQDGLNAMRLALIIIAAVMLFLAFLGFIFSIFGLQCLVYFLVIFGWILVAGTFIVCGVFLFLHNAVADTCVAMDQWVQNPTAHTALDDILPCVDKATAQESLTRTKDVTFQIGKIIDKVITTVTNQNVPPKAGPPLYFNQSGPLVPALCNPFNADLTDRKCAAGEVALDNATEVWKNYTCQVSASGICTTQGRMTPTIYGQMAAGVNVSFALYHYGPFLANVADCTFVRQTFSDISSQYCPGLRKYTQWIYLGLLIVSLAVMLSLIFWVIYARERRHRVYTKQLLTEDKAP